MAFLQISVNEGDRDFIRFQWEKIKKRNTLTKYRVVWIELQPTRTVITSFLKQYQFPRDTAAEKLRSYFNVDNCIMSIDLEENAEHFTKGTSKNMIEAKFDLRGRHQTNDIIVNAKDKPLKVI
ncbi:hypothetical protein NPIL_506171 [Nephila pilipes]|uniref:Uncharacterized protein n=1 Tax=Nephila pilipes TaxID=299642 RepID=A0A8X6U6X1_NEPPI|nr:hypothetical protein NPIL_506171 [Nephila pilipes]